LLLARGPLVLGFFVTDAGPCERAVDAMQAVSATFTRAGVQFAAVAVRADRRAAAAAVRRRHWSIPVAYDRDGAVGQSYGVEACPLLELVRRGGVVAQRLIGKHWTSPAALSGQVRRLVTR
jgi:peroxiredoxin